MTPFLPAFFYLSTLYIYYTDGRLESNIDFQRFSLLDFSCLGYRYVLLFKQTFLILVWLFFFGLVIFFNWFFGSFVWPGFQWFCHNLINWLCISVKDNHSFNNRYFAKSKYFVTSRSEYWQNWYLGTARSKYLYNRYVGTARSWYNYKKDISLLLDLTIVRRNMFPDC